MMALFHTAERYVDQMPGAGPEQFLEYLLNQELPMDTLAARAQVDDAVELMTPASAAGREWPVVIIAGLQEGVGPTPGSGASCWAAPCMPTPWSTAWNTRCSWTR